MGQGSFQKVAEFFGNIARSADSCRELSRYDQIIQFHVLNEQPFFIQVLQGKVSSESGETDNGDFQKVLKVETDAATLTELLERRRTLGEALFERKVDIYGNTAKEHVIAWLSKLFRTGGINNS